LYSEGRIDYREFMRRDISSWPKPLTKTQISAILSGYKIRKEAPETIEELHRRGIRTAIVSSGIDLLAEKVASRLGIGIWVANGLKFDSNGRVMPHGVGRVDPTRKDRAYARLLKKVGIRSSRTIAVGDTVYDLAFLKSAALGFMLAHTTRVDDPRIIHIDRLTDIFKHI
jgi:HAD superfamily PSPase-like hydrolase